MNKKRQCGLEQMNKKQQLLVVVDERKVAVDEMNEKKTEQS